ncbi:hypothetical protein BDY19DRAFT_1046774 [Irpex rosettiformis]|uniref:Uncharacterized protein n=1 Tax=Irpex rosettiformis TaxID=378272 RepID=A0ACB8U9T7_9APHY|nr:hypothetical protein BDY19DRAFT_1046774 [Irpex rosettiformis]
MSRATGDDASALALAFQHIRHLPSRSTVSASATDRMETCKKTITRSSESTCEGSKMSYQILLGRTSSNVTLRVVPSAKEGSTISYLFRIIYADESGNAPLIDRRTCEEEPKYGNRQTIYPGSGADRLDLANGCLCRLLLLCVDRSPRDNEEQMKENWLAEGFRMEEEDKMRGRTVREPCQLD